jgi:hypothetical protein
VPADRPDPAPRSTTELTDYERRALVEVEAWRARSPGRGARAFGRATGVADRPAAWMLERTVVGRVLEGVLSVAMDAGSWTVSEQRVVDAHRRHGADVETFAQVRREVPMPLRDREAARIARRYRAQLAAEGGAAGASAFAGPAVAAAALVADVTFVTTWACRAAAHLAAIYGYRVETPAERAMAMQVLVGATAATDDARQAALADVSRISRQIAQRRTWEELERGALVRAVQDAAEKLGVRLTKAKLGQVVAVVGIVVGAGYNAWYIDRVAAWGTWTYRAHYLEDKLAGFPTYVDDASVVTGPVGDAPAAGEPEVVDAVVVDPGGPGPGAGPRHASRSARGAR